MSITEHRAPFTLTPTDRETLHDLLAKAERLSRELSDAYREAQRIVTETTDLDPMVDLGDPLAMYRLPSGRVGFETDYASEVKVGDWIQACHGDLDWHEVTGLSTTSDRTIGVELNHDRLRWWAPTDAIRIARPPELVVAAQERKAEAGR